MQETDASNYRLIIYSRVLLPLTQIGLEVQVSRFQKYLNIRPIYWPTRVLSSALFWPKIRTYEHRTFYKEVESNCALVGLQFWKSIHFNVVESRLILFYATQLYWINLLINIYNKLKWTGPRKMYGIWK